jgi:hypothetical protein
MQCPPSPGHRTEVGHGDSQFPLAVVRGTPYEMGHHLGRLFTREIQAFVPVALDGIGQELKLAPGVLNEVWSRTSSYGDDRLEQELAGLADGSGVPLSTLQALHAVPLLMALFVQQHCRLGRGDRRWTLVPNPKPRLEHGGRCA